MAMILLKIFGTKDYYFMTHGTKRVSSIGNEGTRTFLPFTDFKCFFFHFEF